MSPSSGEHSKIKTENRKPNQIESIRFIRFGSKLQRCDSIFFNSVIQFLVWFKDFKI